MQMSAYTATTRQYVCLLDLRTTMKPLLTSASDEIRYQHRKQENAGTTDTAMVLLLVQASLDARLSLELN